MNQWNHLKFQIIKTRRVECGKLDLPAVLATPERHSLRSKKKLKVELGSDLDQTSSRNLSRGQEDTRSQSCIVADNIVTGGSSLETEWETEDSCSFLKTGNDEVFVDQYETPNIDGIEEEGFLKREFHKRCLSLPGYVNSEIANYESCDYSREPRRLFKDTSILETSERNRAGGSMSCGSIGDAGEGCWARFPRQEEVQRWRTIMDNKVKSSRTPHAGKIIGQDKSGMPKLVTDHNNNNWTPGGRDSSTLSRSQSSLDLRRDWDQKVLDYTSEKVFGAERVLEHREHEGHSRPRSVTLTGSVCGIVKSEDHKTTRDAAEEKRRVKSESKQAMPKFQNVLWDYMKRRSSKRRGKKYEAPNERRNFGDDATAEGSYEEVPKNRGRNNLEGEKNGSFQGDEKPKVSNDSKKYLSCSGDSNGVTSTRRTFHLPKSKSTSDLESFCRGTGSTKRADGALGRKMVQSQRSNSWDEIQSRENQPKLSLSEFKDNPEILKLLLTTDPEQRPMEERLKTLTLSREWLLKELKALRDDDRRLARQFIHLRSAIMEIRKAREKEELDYDSEGNGCKSKLTDSPRLGLEERNGNEPEYQLHVTPTRNILSYC